MNHRFQLNNLWGFHDRVELFVDSHEVHLWGRVDLVSAELHREVLV